MLETCPSELSCDMMFGVFAVAGPFCKVVAELANFSVGDVVTAALGEPEE